MQRVVRCVVLTFAVAVPSWSPASAYLTDTAPHAPTSYGAFSPPAQGATYTDPVFGTAIRRLSDALGSPNNADGGNLTYVMDEYSTMSAFNRDRSLFLLQHDSYFGLYDGQGSYMGDLPWAIHASSEPRWSREQTYVLYFVNGNQLKRYDAQTGGISVVRTFSEYGRITGNGESDIAFDGDRVVLAGDGRYVFVYDIESGTKGPALDTAGRGFDSLYLTPAGNVTITWYQAGTSRYTGIELFDRNMVFQRQLTRAGGHMDVTRDTDGSEVLVWASSADPAPLCDNGVVKVRLSDARQTCLTELDWSLGIHVSCPDADGACIVSTYAPADPSPSGNWPAYTNEVFQVNLDGSEVRRLAHHRSRPYNGYNYMARATVSRDGRRVVYSSNFGRQESSGAPTEYSDAYLISVAAPSTGGGTDDGGGSGDGGSDDGGSGGDGSSAGTRSEETSSAVSYTGAWHDNATAGHSGGTARLAIDAGSRAKFGFQGTGARWIGYRDEWSGVARVYVDGSLVETVDTYASPAAAQQTLFEVAGLASGAHSLEIEVTGSASPQSSGAWVWVDAFEAISGSEGSGGSDGGSDGGSGDGGGGTPTATTWIDETSSQVTYAGTWHANALPDHRGGSATLAMDRGAVVRLRFSGTGVRWIGYRDEWSGIANVFIDGKLEARVDTYAASAEARKVLFRAENLKAGNHSIEIRVQGRHAAGSAGSWVWVDGFTVLGGSASGTSSRVSSDEGVVVRYTGRGPAD